MDANQDQQDEVVNDQEIVDDSETATEPPVENGPWDDEDYFERYLY